MLPKIQRFGVGIGILWGKVKRQTTAEKKQKGTPTGQVFGLSGRAWGLGALTKEE